MATATFTEQTHRPLVFMPAASSGMLYEVVDGQVREVIVSALQAFIASRLQTILGTFAANEPLGRVVTEMLFNLTAQVGRQRRPDVAFVSYERWPRDRAIPDTEAWDVVPDLAIEVVSRTNLLEDVIAKTKEYFRAGVRRVWVILPGAQEVYDYDGPAKVRIVTGAEPLTGDAVVPGFVLTLNQLFDTPAVENS